MKIKRHTARIALIVISLVTTAPIIYAILRAGGTI